MTAIYIWILLLGLAGGATSIFLIPSDEDKAYSEFKAHKYQDAKGFYTESYEKGNRTADVIIPLSVIDENQGRLNKSISLMQGFLEEHPDNFYGLKRLSELYLLNQQYSEYYDTLLKMQSLKPQDWETLQSLATWYRNTGQKEELFEILKEFIPTGHGDESDYYDLANLYASKGDFSKAHELILQRDDYFKNKLGVNDYLFDLWVNSELSKSEGGQDELMQQSLHRLADFLLHTKKTKLTYFAIGQVNENYPQYTDEFIELLRPQIKHSRYLRTLVLQIQWNTPGEKEKVPPKIRKLIENKHLTPQLKALALSVFLDQEDDDSLLKVISRINGNTVEDSEIFNISINALQKNKPQLAQAMQKSLGEQFLQDQPILATALALGAKDPNAKTQLENVIRNSLLTPEERFYFFQLAHAADLEKETLEIGKQLAPFQGLQPYMMEDIALTYIQLKKEPDLYELIQQSTPPLKKSEAAIPLAMLDITAHKTLPVARWLQENKELKQNTLINLFSVAQKSKEYPLALYLSNLLTERYPSPKSSAYYGQALVQMGIFKGGMEILRGVYAENKDSKPISESYFSALVFAAKRDRAYQEELLAYMQEQEARGPLSQSTMRDFQYVYLDVFHDYENGKRLAYLLAKDAPAKSQDLENLIYLWGPKPSEEDIAWLAERSEKANVEEIAFWINTLNYVGEYELALELFRRHCDQSRSAEAYLAYMDTLTYLKMHPELRCAIYASLPLMETRKQLERIAGYSEEAVYLEAKRFAWEKIVCMEPDDPIAWQNLARSAFQEHDYNKTINVIEHLFTMDIHPNDPKFMLYELNYEYGNALKKQRLYCLADRFFCLALKHIDAVQEPTIKMLEIKALALYELGKVKDALATLYTVFEKTSRDPESAASFANMLMGEGMLTGARDFLKSLQFPCQEYCEESF